MQTLKQSQNLRAVVVAQLIELSLPTWEVSGSNPVIGKIYTEHFFMVLKRRKLKTKEAGKCPLLKSQIWKKGMSHRLVVLWGESLAKGSTKNLQRNSSNQNADIGFCKPNILGAILTTLPRFGKCLYYKQPNFVITLLFCGPSFVCVKFNKNLPNLATAPNRYWHCAFVKQLSRHHFTRLRLVVLTYSAQLMFDHLFFVERDSMIQKTAAAALYHVKIITFVSVSDLSHQKCSETFLYNRFF